MKRKYNKSRKLDDDDHIPLLLAPQGSFGILGGGQTCNKDIKQEIQVMKVHTRTG